ncbi:MAG: response regulator transcription factor [Acidobacteriota bacterium]
MLRVLVVEDDEATLEFIRKGLSQEGLTVDTVTDGLLAYAAARDASFDLIIMDIMLPGIDGLTVLQRLRREKVETPVLVLSAKGDLDDRVRGLRAGGDDYLTKPFAFAELIARIEALVRRSGHLHAAPLLHLGGLTLDRERHLLFVDGEPVDLQPGEFKLLSYLMRNRGRVVSKTMILDHVWGYGFDPQTNVVEAKISRLRSKLAAHTTRELIRTVRGLGYRFEAADESPPSRGTPGEC